MGVVQPAGWRIGAEQERQAQGAVDRTGMDFFRNENFRPGMPHNVAADRAVVAVLVIRAVVGAPAGC